MLLDYIGRGALVLNQRNKMSLLRSQIHWYDLAWRSKPIGMFQIPRSPYFIRTIANVLRKLRVVSGIFFKDATIDWVAEAAYTLSEHGAIGLGAIYKCLSNPELRRLHLQTQGPPEDLEKAVEALAWALNFSAVYAISEGHNRVRLAEELNRPVSIWVEMFAEHFEKCEHQILSLLVEAAVEEALLRWGHDHKGKNATPQVTVVHLFPPLIATETVPPWVKETAGLVKHVAIHHFDPRQPLPPAVLDWVTKSACLWIPRSAKPLKRSCHQAWLLENEENRINSLGNNDIWIRDTRDGKGITAKLDLADELVGLAHILRKESYGKKQLALQNQMSGRHIHLERQKYHRNLYQSLCSLDTLQIGWLKAKNARGESCGVDGVTLDAFKSRVDQELKGLRQELLRRKYRCRPLRRITLPKPDSGHREIGIACMRDRVVFSSILHLLEPIFEPKFSRFSFAFRPRRNTHQALTVVRSMIAAGSTWAVTADIRKCFDSIDHDLLLELLANDIDDHDLLQLIIQILAVDVFGFDDMLPVAMGVPQGSSLSPLLANIYLDPLDKHLERQGIAFVRYADDIVALTDSEDKAKNILGTMKSFLMDQLRLALKPAKTDITKITEGFDYLGFHINDRGLSVRKSKLELVEKSLELSLRQLGDPKISLKARAELLIRLNSQIMGIRNYFAFDDSEPAIADQMRQLDERLESLANFILPESFRQDPFWDCRERFAPGSNQPETVAGKASSTLIGIGTGGYPESRDASPPAGWLVKDEPVADNKTPQKCCEVDASGDDAVADGIVVDADHLYILQHGSYLTLEDDCLVIKKKKKEIFRRAFSEISLVFLQGKGMTIAVNLQLAMAENDIPLVFCPMVGKPSAILSGTVSVKPHLRGQQILRRNEPDVVACGLNMLAAKTANQAALIRYFAKYRKKTGPELHRAITSTAGEIRRISETISGLAPDSAMIREKAMGYEGQAAAMYWKVLTHLVDDGLEFHGRVTKGAADLVNQSLNYTYGILYGLVWQAVIKAGLDPYFGIMHGAKKDQGSLVFDLIEEFRAPFADRLVFALLGRGFIPKQNHEGLLNTTSRKKLAQGFVKKWRKEMAWRSHSLSPDRILASQARSLAEFFLRENRYQPFRMRW